MWLVVKVAHGCSGCPLLIGGVIRIGGYRVKRVKIRRLSMGVKIGGYSRTRNTRRCHQDPVVVGVF